MRVKGSSFFYSSVMEPVTPVLKLLSLSLKEEALKMIFIKSIVWSCAVCRFLGWLVFDYVDYCA